MLVLIFGKDTYRAWQKLKEIVSAFEKENKISLSLDSLGDEVVTIEDLKNELRHSSMFEKKKIVILRNVLGNANFKEGIIKEIKSLSGNEDVSIIFYEEGNASIDADFLKLLKKQGTVYKFDLLKAEDSKKWIKEELSLLGATIKPDALVLLVNSTGGDLWRLSSEIKKLVAYKAEKKSIEKKDVELLVRPNIEAVIFKTIDAIASGNKKIALDLLYKHLGKGDSPFYIFSMIIYQFRNLLIVKELESSSFEEKVKILRPMHPFVVKKSSWLANEFSLVQLKDIYLKIFKMDLAVKTGKIKPETALELLIADI
ncbi:DNA polymerase III subunit delta [Patescibacteria group bacterium]|nr:DNA polymerase III subunit delta [Patescibacteria group bacterium]MBU4162029.1 DNA polymerase III subunit delta [Patescibacteria group bacterium]